MWYMPIDSYMLIDSFANRHLGVPTILLLSWTTMFPLMSVPDTLSSTICIQMTLYRGVKFLSISLQAMIEAP